MSIWSTPTIRGIECGALCRECALPVTDNPEGEEITCEECLEENERIDENLAKEDREARHQEAYYHWLEMKLAEERN